jgi:hypothetical protein
MAKGSRYHKLSMQRKVVARIVEPFRVTDGKAFRLRDSRPELPLVEDDVYGELAFGGKRPRAAKACDRRGLVVLCSSFSRFLSPGLRLGWVAGGRYRARIDPEGSHEQPRGAVPFDTERAPMRMSS